MYYSVSNPNRTIFATSYYRRQAQHYLKPLLSAYVNDRTDSKGIFKDYNTFKKYIREVFRITNEKNTAVRIIQSLKQKTSATDYTARFREYANLTDQEDNGPALIAMFYKGLKENIKDKLIRDRATHDNFDQLSEAAIRIDDKLYERVIEKRHTIGGRAFGLPGWSGGGRNRGDPIEINNL